MPADEMGFRLVEAPTTGDAERLMRRARIETEPIVEAVDVDTGRWARADDLQNGGHG